MTGLPAPTLCHRWLGWHAPAMRRAVSVLIAGLLVAVVLLPFVTWGLALTGGWPIAAARRGPMAGAAGAGVLALVQVTVGRHPYVSGSRIASC